jgi:hypothetical protein
MPTKETFQLDDPRGDEIIAEMQQYPQLFTSGVNVVAVGIDDSDFIVMGFVVEGTFVNMMIPAEIAADIGKSVTTLANEVMQKKMH